MMSKSNALTVLIAVLVVAGCVLVFFAVRHWRTKDTVGLQVRFTNLRGKIAPEIQVADLTKHMVNIPSKTGHPVLLEIIATWCDDCRDEIPVVNEFARKFKDFHVIAVVGDGRGQDLRPEGISDIRKFVRRYRVSYDVSDAAHPRIADAYDAWAYPSLYFIRSDGVIEYNIAGDVPYATLALAGRETMRDVGKKVDPAPAVFPTP